ncbi:MAG: ribonuclease PH [Planctomycetes bacterium]|nr:ribonuclease PH [Planctomycetota bacterium]
MARKNNRSADALRPITFTRGYTDLPGSVLAECGKTKVLCTVSVQDQVPQWMYNRHQGGWLTAEYSMLPGAGQPRKPRDGRTGRPLDGRSFEIQRLIGRALRCAIDLQQLPEVTLWVDCDVINADGGTRTTSVNGAVVALYDALLWMEEQKQLPKWPLRGLVSAVSVGVVGGTPMLDLDYSEDSGAEVDLSIVSTEDGRLIEVQGGAEKRPFAMEQFHQMIALGQTGCAAINGLQKKSLGI